ncbi:MAG TPA: ribose 5-phosphate isomerase B [Cyclobacteriaceae bacterium]|jgi:ribose 5-phosphate isomerase B
MKPKIILGSDHAGFHMKQSLREWLITKGYVVEDFGVLSDSPADYPDIAHPVAKRVSEDDTCKGILLCGSGNGVAITANKHANIRAAICWNDELASLARLHNDANILCIPARFVTTEDATTMSERFLTTEFEGGRHQRRVDKMRCA